MTVREARNSFSVGPAGFGVTLASPSLRNARFAEFSESDAEFAVDAVQAGQTFGPRGFGQGDRFSGGQGQGLRRHVTRMPQRGEVARIQILDPAPARSAAVTLRRAVRDGRAIGRRYGARSGSGRWAIGGR